jgi:class 3 adenylate cyclase
VRAALALVDAIAHLRTNVDAALQVRVGIATGTVVVSDLLSNETAAEQAAVGETRTSPRACKRWRSRGQY